MHGKACKGAALVVALVKGLADSVGTNGVFAVVVGDVAILAVLVVVVFVALSLPSRCPNVLARMRGLSATRNVIPSACIRFEAATRPRFLRAVYRTRIFPPPPPGWMTRGIVGGLENEM